MIRKKIIETIAGVVVLCVAIFLVIYVNDFINEKHNKKYCNFFRAQFNDVSCLSFDSQIKLSGIKIGTISDIELNQTNYKVDTTLCVEMDVKIPVDSILSVVRDGFFGTCYLKVEPGLSNEYMKNNETFTSTRSSIDWSDLILKFVGKNEL